MVKIKKISLTFVQMLVGCCCGVLAGVISLFLVNLAWKGIQQVNLGGFLTALLLLISFLAVFAATVAATAEGVRQMGRFLPRQASRRKIYEGSFMGICAAVAILTVTRADWLSTFEEWGGSPVAEAIKLLGTLFYYVIVRPVNFLIYWIPALLLLAIAAPIGAAIGYNLPASEKKDQESKDTKDTKEQPEGMKGRRKKR